jgi:hypothetical protein
MHEHRQRNLRQTLGGKYQGGFIQRMYKSTRLSLKSKISTLLKKQMFHLTGYKIEAHLNLDIPQQPSWEYSVVLIFNISGHLPDNYVEQPPS